MKSLRTNLSQQLAHRLATLVAARTTTSAPAVSADMLHSLAAELQNSGLHVMEGTVGGFPHLYTHFQPLPQTKVWFYAHIDVVEGDSAQFKLDTRDGRYYARGAYDMKFAIAVYMQLCADFAASKPPIGFIITSDEESSGEFGAGYLARLLKLKDKTIVIPDGGGPWSLEKSAKGMLWCRLESAGTAAHGSRPELGVNAIDKLMAAITEIKTALNAASGTDFADTTVNVATISGGNIVNQVPAAASAELDIRFAPPVNLSQVEHILKNMAHNAGVNVSITNRMPAIAHNVDHPDTLLLRSIMAEHVLHPIEFTNSYGASDAVYFNKVGANTILFYPEGGGHHGRDEYITAHGLEQTYDILRQFICDITVVQPINQTKPQTIKPGRK